MSLHFSIAELTTTRTGIPNVPPTEAEARLHVLCAEVLEPVRALLGVPLRVTSGYRSPEVNRVIGGAPGSQHMRGDAADVVPVGLPVAAAMAQIARAVADGRLVVDQAIVYPAGGFLHLSYRAGHNRGELLTSAARSGSGGPYTAWRG